MRPALLLSLALYLASLGVAGCGGDNLALCEGCETPTATPTVTPSGTPTASPGGTPSTTPTPTL